MSLNNQNIINPKPCNYGCNTRIYWHTSENAYYEVFSGNRHQCPNRSKFVTSTNNTTVTTTNKPSYYNKFAKQPKPKMSNSLELLQGSIADVQKKYEILSDIASSEANGKVHGSQSHIVNTANSVISLIVYYEVPESKKEEVNQKFKNLARNTITLKQRN